MGDTLRLVKRFVVCLAVAAGEPDNKAYVAGVIYIASVQSRAALDRLRHGDNVVQIGRELRALIWSYTMAPARAPSVVVVGAELAG